MRYKFSSNYVNNLRQIVLITCAIVFLLLFTNVKAQESQSDSLEYALYYFTFKDNVYPKTIPLYNMFYDTYYSKKTVSYDSIISSKYFNFALLFKEQKAYSTSLNWFYEILRIGREIGLCVHRQLV